MKEGPNIAHVAALIGDPARANMLTALMSGKALTATELSGEAGVTVQTASAHLAKLETGGLLDHRKSGRHKYFKLANEDVAHILEGLMGLAASAGQMRTRTGPKNEEMLKARACYNHLAGNMGIQLFNHLSHHQHLSIGAHGLTLSPSGEEFMSNFGIDLAPLHKKKTPMCRECLDWSERKSHLAGSLGNALLNRILDLGWAKRVPDSRIVRFSADGKRQFERVFPAS